MSYQLEAASFELQAMRTNRAVRLAAGSYRLAARGLAVLGCSYP